MDQVDAVTHPLIRDAAGKILVEAEFEIEARIERTEGLGHQPALPIGVGLAELRNLLASAPARSVIVPDNFDFSEITERATLENVIR